MLRTLFNLIVVVTVALGFSRGTFAQDEPFGQSPLDSPFLVEPQTPIDIFDAARISVQLARPALAKQYIDKLLEDASDEDLLEIREKFGVAELLRFAGIRELLPSSRTLLQRSNAAFRKNAEDPERLQRIIQGLTGTPTDRAVALESLRAGGPNVVGAMLRVLADDTQAELHEPVTIALSRMTPDAVPAIRAGIDSPNVRVRTSCLVAMGYLGDRSVVPYLWRPAFAPDVPSGVRAAARKTLQQLLAGVRNRPRRINNIGAAEDLYHAALQYFNGSHRWSADEEGNVVIWNWSGDQLAGTPTESEMASLQTGARLARDAMELAPEDLKKQGLYLAFSLAHDSRKAGWTKPLPVGTGTAQNAGLSVGPKVLSEALSVSLANNNSHAARAALAAIWQVGQRDLLRRTNDGSSPIYRALSHPDQRIQLAAANAILNLSPNEEFVGSTQVLAILSRALRNDGRIKCLVADPNNGRANAMATMIGDLGYVASTTSTGRGAFKAASERSDVSLVALNANVSQWTLSETIANLKADARTSGIPIVIYGPPFVRGRIATTLSRYNDITFMEESDQADDASRKLVELSLKPFLETTLPQVSEAELAAQKSLAADWFAQLAGARRASPLNLALAQPSLLDGVSEEPIARQCIQALGAIPTAEIQVELQQIAVSEINPESTRLFAMNELAFHIQRNSLMLGPSQQLDIIKLSQLVANTPLSSAAAALAGSMQPSARQTFKRLRQYRPQ
jgi:HEAT repeat protein